MTQRSSRRKDPPPTWFSGLIVLITTLTVAGLTIADFVNDGRVDKLWIAALLVLALTFGGYGADKMFGKWWGP